MHRVPLLRALLCLLWAAGQGYGQVSEQVQKELQGGQMDLAEGGRAFLLKEASSAHFFLLGELHGENEIPELIRSIWPSLWKSGYRHVGAEVSPWMANQLEFGGGRPLPLAGLWTRSEARIVSEPKGQNRGHAVLWGCDMEEARADLLISELAAANRHHAQIRKAVAMFRNGYQRKLAPELLRNSPAQRAGSSRGTRVPEHAGGRPGLCGLLRVLRTADGVKDRSIGGRSLLKSILETLEIEVLRLSGERMAASVRRESTMKEIFHERWESGGRPKVLLRFGRNHLHRGLDRRGVSTLGNFVSEVALAHRRTTFHVAAFAGGGQVRLLNEIMEWDERGDDPAFGLLAALARFPVTVYDLRPIRQALHRIPENKRSPAEASLTYWADSYDAILYYREVTPIGN
ncbi:MAG: hypothetical protein JNK48_05195 [Bryobacterales bacterium]|nr:hypothetical protein [Bryobacterales bacterium]